MKPLGLMLAAAAAACSPGSSNEVAPVPVEENAAGSSSDDPVAPGSAGAGEAGGERPRDGKSSPGAEEVQIARPGDTPPDPSADDADQCGASRYQWLVGRPRSAIPARPSGASWRVACTSCPITQDYSPARLNIFYDSETERIEEVRCG